MTVFDEAYAYFKSNPDDLCLMWTRFNWTYPPPKPFLEFVFHGRDYVAWYEDQPPPATIRVRTMAALNVRSAPVVGDNKVTTLAKGTIIEVYEAETVSGWKQISAGVYAGKWVSAAYVERVT